VADETEIVIDDADLLPIEDDSADGVAPAKAADATLDDVISKALDGADGDDPAGDRARDDKGRFAPKESDAAAAPVDGTSDATVSVSTEPAQNAQPDPTSEGHFRGWSPEQREVFGKLPPEAQKLALDVVKGRDQFYGERISEYDYALKGVTPLVNAVQPHLERIHAVTPDPSAYVAHVLDVDRKLRFAPYAEKVNLLGQLAQSIGVPFAAPQADPFNDPVTPGGEAYPVIHDLQTQVSQLQLQLQGYQRQNETAQQQQLTTTIQAFQSQANADGSPKHPLFEQVRGAMGQLLRDNRAHSMEEAYELASRPIQAAISAQVEAQRKTAEAAQKAALEKAKKARPIRTSGVAPGGRTKEAGLDSILNSAFDRAGFN
jgi:hypothetical protein